MFHDYIEMKEEIEGKMTAMMDSAVAITNHAEW